MSTSRRLFLTGLAAAAGAASCSTSAGQPQAEPSTPPAGGTSAPTAAGTASATTPGTAPATASATATTPAGPTPAALGDVLHGPRTVPAVALTFHGAGDPAVCREVLARVAAARAQVTVLAIGSWLERNPALAPAILDAGHELGNHTWSHPAMRHLGAQDAHREVQRAADVLDRLTGTPGRWFRPSGTPRSTATIRAAARESGYARCLAYDVDPLDYTDPGPAAITRRLLGVVRPGSIVSLHLGHPGTVAALPDVLTGLSRRGLRVVTTSQLLGGAR